MDDNLELGMNAYRMDFLLSKGQVLEGHKFNMIWSSKDESAYGENGGTIRNLAIRYLKDEMNGNYEPEVQYNWKIGGVDTNTPARAAVVELINKGILAIPTTEDGKFTNIASINVNDAITKKEIEELTQKAKVDSTKFSPVKTTGDFYQQLVKVLTTSIEEKEKGMEEWPKSQHLQVKLQQKSQNQLILNQYYLKLKELLLHIF